MHEKPLDATPRMLRQFAGLWLLFFAGMAAWHGLQHDRHTVALILTILAVTIGPAGLIAPRIIKPLFVGWMMAVYPIGWLVSRVVLGAIFFALFSPLGLFFRATGRDELKLKAEPEAKSYWRAKPQVTDKARYLRQF